MPRKPESPENRKIYKGDKNLRFSQKVRERRLELKLKQSELAERLGCKQSQVSALEGGVFVDNAERLETLCRALETDPNHLFGFDKDKGG